MSGLYAADGSINVTVLSSPSSYTGLYASDGSLNVVSAPGSSFVGAFHACGALYVTHNTSGSSYTGIRNVDGSLWVETSPYYYAGGQRVTVVSGSFSGGGSGANDTYYWLLF